MVIPSMKVLKRKCHLGTLFSGAHRGPGIIVGLDDFRDFFSSLTDSMIQFHQYAFLFFQMTSLSLKKHPWKIFSGS